MRTHSVNSEQQKFLQQLIKVSNGLHDWAEEQFLKGYNLDNVKLRIRDAASLCGRV